MQYFFFKKQMIFFFFLKQIFTLGRFLTGYNMAWDITCPFDFHSRIIKNVIFLKGIKSSVIQKLSFRDFPGGPLTKTLSS